jgi:hypothetical protein
MEQYGITMKLLWNQYEINMNWMCKGFKAISLCLHVGFLKVYRQASTLFLFHCCTDSSTFCAWAAWTGQYILEEIY